MVRSRFSTTCHQPPGTYMVSPGPCIQHDQSVSLLELNMSRVGQLLGSGTQPVMLIHKNGAKIAGGSGGREEGIRTRGAGGREGEVRGWGLGWGG